jgi:hypothetical protein
VVGAILAGLVETFFREVADDVVAGQGFTPHEMGLARGCVHER